MKADINNIVSINGGIRGKIIKAETVQAIPRGLIDIYTIECFEKYSQGNRKYLPYKNTLRKNEFAILSIIK